QRLARRRRAALPPARRSARGSSADTGCVFPRSPNYRRSVMGDSVVTATAVEIARSVNARERSASETLDAMMTYVRRVEGEVGAFLTLTEDVAREHAERVDARIARGEQLALAGVPVAVKDNMCL